ncbi:MAG: DUF2341 domain-containing protein [Nanoarchaeota archaeon]|nr:DUF2341 domain-containing protein [Nanoarchaeota archaeon]
MVSDKAQKVVFFSLLLVIITSYVIFFSTQANAQDEWWNENWQYRQKITVDENSGTTLTEYQVRLLVDTSSLVSASKMNSDCSDIRFTDDAGQGIDYWIENNCNTLSTVIWVQVPQITASGSADIYMYYGNPSANSASSGISTFLFFDNFENPSWSSEHWTQAYQGTDGSWIIENGYAEFSSGSSPGAISLADGIGFNDYIIESKTMHVGSPGASMGLIARADINGNYYHQELDQSRLWLYKFAEWSYHNLASSSVLSVSGDTWYKIKFAVSGAVLSAYSYEHDAEISASDSDFSSGRPGIQVYSQTARFDDFVVRKYASIEPTYSFGSEELFDDTTPPTWDNQDQHWNSVDLGDINELEAYGSDDRGLSQAMLSTNETGTWTEITDGTYGSPFDCSGSIGPIKTKFDWLSTSVAEGSTIAWKIRYIDMNDNDAYTDEMRFNIKVSGTPEQYCSDDTLYGECSTVLPLYCDDGDLVDNCDTCGCSTNLTCIDNECFNVSCTPETSAACGSNIGLCTEGLKTCQMNGTWSECVGGTKPVNEICDALDNDCDSEIDEGCLCRNGETRQCNGPDRGECKYGISVCENGQWTECYGGIEPLQEVCNGKDDNCDGNIDNVAGANSIESTHCQCYGGEEPKKELCNGVDDDCDSNIDESSECCNPGETRDCGTTLGICEKGISTCNNDNLWGTCEGGIKPEPTEICGNEEDDNCDGKSDQYDPQCKACDNGEQDEFEAGVDCGGPCEMFCFEIPWLIIITAAVIMTVIIIFIVYPAMVRRTIEVGTLE